ncbi:MAG: MFS transporter [Pseudonocardia sp.]
MQATRELSRSGLRRVLAVLCGTEIVSWGVLYYAFPVLAPAIAIDTGWPISTVTAAFSVGLVVAAVVGIPAGRWLDRWGPRPVMTAGSLLAAPAVVGIATAPTLPWFFASWAVAGIAMAGVLYPPAFAALTRWWGPRRVTALTALTLLAGLASTIFAPVTGALSLVMDWRQTYLVLAVVLATLTIPAHLLGLRGPWPPARDEQLAGHDEPPGTPDPEAPDPEAPDPGTPGPEAPHKTARSRQFVLLTGAIGLGSFTAFAVVVNQVPLLIERGLTATAAAWALGLGGLGQVLGRLGYRRLADATSTRTRGVVILAAGAGCIGLMAVVPGPATLLVAAAMLTGAARGVFTLLQATAVSDRWGTAHYGRLNGLLSAPAMLAAAVAPWVGAVLAEQLGGYPALFGVLAGLTVLAAVLAAGTMPPGRAARAGRGGPVGGSDDRAQPGWPAS